MDKLSELYAAIDRLSRDEFRQLRAYVEQRVEPAAITDEDPQSKIAALRAATVDFWEGITEEEIDEIVEEMNSEYVEPLSKSDWLDGEDEH